MINLLKLISLIIEIRRYYYEVIYKLIGDIMKDTKKFSIFIIAIVIAIPSIFIYKGAIAPKCYDKYLI